MCRLFGFRSINKEQVHHALLAASNALVVQSEQHGDGWGIAYYQCGIPHLYKGLNCASHDEDFKTIGKLLTTNTVIAHVRRATQGKISLVNCHPFQYGNWLMAHNGELPKFEGVRNDLLDSIADKFLSNIFGTTDSEVYFILFLNQLQKMNLIDEKSPCVKKCAEALRSVVRYIEHIYQRKNIDEAPVLNTIISNGLFLLGLCKGKELSFSVHHKGLVGGEYLASNLDDGYEISQIMICSEPLTTENNWHDLKDGQIVAMDDKFKLFLSF
jgi:glutamine amidotransferase